MAEPEDSFLLDIPEKITIPESFSLTQEDIELSKAISESFESLRNEPKFKSATEAVEIETRANILMEMLRRSRPGRDMENIHMKTSTSKAAGNEIVSWNIEHTIQGSNVLIHVEPADDLVDFGLSQYTSPLSSRRTFRLPRRDLGQVRHETVFYLLSGKFGGSDSDINTVTGSIKFDGNDLSPDFLMRTKNTIHSFELKTLFLGSLTNSFRKAQEKYRPAFINYRREMIAAGKKPPKVMLSAMAVGQDQVVTDLDLSQEEVQALVHFYNLGVQIENYFISKGMIQVAELRDSDEYKRLEAARDKAADKSKLPKYATLPIISQNIMEHWRNDEPDIGIDDFARELYKKADAHARKLTTDKGEFKQKCLESFFRAWDKDTKKSTMDSFMKVPLIWTRPVIDKYARADEESFYLKQISLPHNQPIIGIWANAASLSRHEYAENFRTKTKSQLLSESLTSSARQTPNKNRARVRLKLNESEYRYLATRGVAYRNYRSELPALLVKERSKEGYSRKTPVDDIDRFVLGEFSDLMRQSPVLVEDVLGKSIEKLRFINEDIYYRDEGVDGSRGLEKQFAGTKLGQMLLLNDRILNEVNSSLSDFCNRTGEMVLKRVRGTEIFLLLRPTDPSKHISVSIRYPVSPEFQKIEFFKEGVFHDGYYYTHFFTLNRHKLSALLNSFEKTLSMIALWCELFRIDPVEYFENPKTSSQVSPHVAASLLVMFETTNQTSAHLQHIRFAYMEVCKGPPETNNPFKIFTKWDTFPRSRLLVWIIKRFIKTFDLMSREESRPRMMKVASNEEELGKIPRLGGLTQVSQDQFHNLLSWVTAQPVRHFDIALNLSYMSHLHNRDEGDEAQGFKNIFAKVCKQERTMKFSKEEYMGRRSRTNEQGKPVMDYLGHEFSKDWMMHCSAMSRRYLNSISGGDYRAHFRSRFAVESLKRTSERYATLKASAITKDFEEVYSRQLEDQPSTKVLGAVIDLIDKEMIDHIPFSSIDKLLDALEVEGLLVKLFKKKQIGGTREIFILSGISRIVINYLETMSRVVCMDMPSEMMTKPWDKIKKTNQHYTKVFRVAKKNNMEPVYSIDSNDASTWAQRFVMPVFGITLSKILPPEEYTIACRILNLVTKKKLMLPLGKLLHEYHDIRKRSIFSMNDDLTELKKQALGLSKDNDLMDANSTFMKNTSNMMQGILHYTSSLMHACHLFTLRKINEGLCKRMLPDTVYIETPKESSDDSSILRTIMVRTGSKDYDDTVRAARVLLTIFSVMNRIAYVLFTGRLSLEKSTNNSMIPFEEFNSIWMIFNTVVLPIIKFVYAAVKAEVISSFDDRQRNWANLRQQLAEVGASFSLIHLVQSCQERINYTLLGAYVSPLFDEYIKRLQKCPHPSFGFFIKEPKRLCGVGGYDYALYNSVLRNDRTNEVHHYLLRRDGLEIDADGRPTVSITMLMGNIKNWQAFTKKVKMEETNFREYFENNPTSLFQSSSNAQEAKMKIMKKLSSPSTIDSFTFGAPSKIYASAVYILHKPSITFRQKLDKETVKKKISLIKALDTACLQDYGQMPETLVEMTFESSMTYDQLNSLLSQYSRAEKQEKVFQRAKTVNKFSYPRMMGSAPVRLSDYCYYLWFGQRKKKAGSVFSHTVSGKIYKEVFPWLNPDIEKSLADSPFVDKMSMIDFVISRIPRNTSRKVLAPIRGGLPFVKMIETLISMNHSTTHVLSLDPKTRRKSPEQVEIASKVSLILSNPYRMPSDKLKQVLIFLRRRKNFFSSVQTLARLSRKMRALAVIQLYAKHIVATDKQSPNNNIFLQAYKASNLGEWGYFSAAQSKDKFGRYIGPGTYEGEIDGIQFRIQLENNRIKLFEVSDYKEMAMKSKRLFKLISKAGLIKEGMQYFLKVQRNQAIRVFNTENGIMSTVNIKQESAVQVVENPQLKWSVSLNPNVVRAKIEDKTLSLVVQPAGFPSSTIIKFSPNIWWLDKVSESRSTAARIGPHNFWEFWENNLPMEPVSIARIVKYLRRNSHRGLFRQENVDSNGEKMISKVIDPNKLLEQMKSALKLRAKHLGYSYAEPDILRISEIADEQDLTPLEAQEMTMFRDELFEASMLASSISFSSVPEKLEEEERLNMFKAMDEATMFSKEYDYSEQLQTDMPVSFTSTELEELETYSVHFDHVIREMINKFIEYGLNNKEATQKVSRMIFGTTRVRIYSGKESYMELMSFLTGNSDRPDPAKIIGKEEEIADF